MTHEDLPLKTFAPDVYIELDDAYTGTRKIARVNETGAYYVDLSDAGATAFPIYEFLKPEEAGGILGWGLWLADRHPEEQPKWTALVDRLIHESGQDPLTYNRAAHWAFTNRTYDYDRALAAGIAATAAVRAGRATMDGTLDASGVLQ